MARPLKADTVGNGIAGFIEGLILDGTLRPGEKLASERGLSDSLGVSRPTLREAIAILSQKGLLDSSASGTYVAEFLGPLVDPLAKLYSDKPHVTGDYLEFRRCLEGEAGQLAALRATDVDRETIRQILDRIKKAHKIEDPSEEAEADVQLHLSIYEASHNLIILHVMRAMAELFRKDVFYNRQQLYQKPNVREKLLNQHLEIGQAIINGDAEAARKASEDHISFTSDTIEEIRRDKIRMDTSLSRVDRGHLLARRK